MLKGQKGGALPGLQLTTLPKFYHHRGPEGTEKGFLPGEVHAKEKPLERAVNLREREKGDKG